MLFFTRCFICIGAVVALAEGVSPTDLWRARDQAVGTARQSLTENIDALCRRDPARCLAVAEVAAGQLGLEAAAGDPAEPTAGRHARPVPVRRARAHLSSEEVAPR